MPGIAWVALVTLLACSAAGVVALAAAPRWLRAVLVPAAPAVGVVVLVLPLTWLHVALPGRVAAGVVWVVLGAAGAAVALRAPDRLPTGRQWRGLAVALGVGIVLAVPSLAPNLRAGTSWVVQAGPNHDAVWHVGSVEWFLDHRAGERPRVEVEGTGREGPFIWPTALAIDDGMRRGEPLLQGALSVITGRRPMAAWSPVTAVWVALLPGALAAAVRMLGGSRRAALAAGLVGASSAVLATQVLWQHGPSVVAGCGPLPLALGLTWLAPRHRAAAVAAGLAWAGVVTLYNELLPLSAPVAVLLLVGRLVLGRRRALANTAVAAVVAAVAAAPTLVRVVGYLRGLAEAPTKGLSPYGEGGRLSGLLRALGLQPVGVTFGATTRLLVGVAALVVVLALVAAAAPSLRLRRARPLRAAAVVLAATVAGAEVLALRRGEAYSAKRVLDTGAPLVLGLAAAVLAEGVLRPRVRRGVAALGLAALGLAVGANLWSGWRAGDVDDLAARTVDADLRATAEHARALGDVDGRGVLVAVGSYFDEHWLGLLLVNRPGIAYPVIGPGYAVGARYGAMDGVVAVVVDDEVVAALPAPTTMGRFRVAEVVGRSWSVVQFGGGWYEPEQSPGGPARWMADEGAIVVTGHDLGCAVPVTVRALQPTAVTRHIPGIDDRTFPARPEAGVVDLQLPGVPIVDATLSSEPPAVAGVDGDPRARSIRLSAATPPVCAPP